VIVFIEQMELHFSEPWFHRIVQRGRGVAEELLRQNASLGDGTFLVRPSETFVGAYSLSFLRKGEVCKFNEPFLHFRTQFNYLFFIIFGIFKDLGAKPSLSSSKNGFEKKEKNVRKLKHCLVCFDCRECFSNKLYL
jgi:hypothetical protein